MLGGGQEHDLGIESLEIHEVTGEVPLAGDVEAALDDGAVDAAAAALDVGEQRDDGVLHLVEEVVVERAVAAVLEVVEPDVVGVGVGVAEARDADHARHDAVEVGLEGGPVVGDLGAAPHRVGLGGEAGEVGLDLVGDVGEAAAVALEDPDLVDLGVGQEVLHGREAVEQAAGLVGAEELLVLGLEDGLGLAAVGRGGLGVDRGAVGADAGLGVAVGIEVHLELVEGGDVRARVVERRRRGGRGRARELLLHGVGEEGGDGACALRLALGLVGALLVCHVFSLGSTFHLLKSSADARRAQGPPAAVPLAAAGEFGHAGLVAPCVGPYCSRRDERGDTWNAFLASTSAVPASRPVSSHPKARSWGSAASPRPPSWTRWASTW